MADDYFDKDGEAGDGRKSRILQRIIRAAIQSREDRCDEIFDQIESFDDIKLGDQSGNSVQVLLSMEFRREVGARLHNRNPTVRVMPEDWSSDADKARAPVEEDYLNLCMQKTGYFRTCRDIIDMSFGAYGVAWVGLNEDDPRLASVEHVNWRDFYMDPEARQRLEDCRFIVRRRRKPRYWMYANFKGKRQVIDQMAGKIPRVDESEDQAFTDLTTEIVEFYEVYTLTGLKNFREGMRGKPAPDNPQYYCVDAENWRVLRESDWPIPRHKCMKWPVNLLYYYPRRNSPYPTPPLEPGITWQKVINSAWKNLVEDFEWSTRRFIATLETMGIEVEMPSLDNIRKSRQRLQQVKVKIKNNQGSRNHGALPKINELITELDLFDKRVGDKLAEISQFEQKFHMAVGLYPHMYAGEPSTQDRSAVATRFRAENADSRLNDMQGCIDDFHSELMRMLLYVGRIFTSPEEIGQLQGDQAGQAWGTLVSPDRRADMGYWVDHYMTVGRPPEQAQEMAMDTMQSAVDVDSWEAASNVSIEVGSTKRKTPEETFALTEAANNQLTAVLEKMGMPQAAGYFAASMAKHLDIPDTEIATMLTIAQQRQQNVNMQTVLDQQMLQLQIAQLQQQVQMGAQPAEEGAPQPQGQQQ